MIVENPSVDLDSGHRLSLGLHSIVDSKSERHDRHENFEEENSGVQDLKSDDLFHDQSVHLDVVRDLLGHFGSESLVADVVVHLLLDPRVEDRIDHEVGQDRGSYFVDRVVTDCSWD